MKYISIFALTLSLFFSIKSTAQLFINEVMPSNNNAIADSAGEYEDWFEVYNAGDNPVDIAGYYFTDALSNTSKWQVPSTNAAKTTIPAKGYKIFWADENEAQGEDHTNFKLSDAGELIYLYQPDGNTIVDGITFPALAANQSYGRNTDGSSLLVSFEQSTPEMANSGGIPLATTPLISPQSGVYSSNQTVTIASATPGADIYYTTDGSAPNQNSTYYSAPFSIGSSVSVRAIAIKSGYTNSKISTASYIYYNTNLPIISVSTKPANLWNDNSGIYVVGTNGLDGNCMPGPANFNQKWERPANITMIETDGSLAFNTNAGISISGGCSRRNPQKSLNIAAKSIYGASNFKHQIFPEYQQKKFKRFKLRNGGNEFNGLAMRDIITQSIVEGEIDIDQQRARACVVFINGTYWGIMTIRDSYSEHWINENHKIADKDSIDLFEPSGSSKYARIIEGSADAYIDLYEFIENNGLDNQDNYNYVKSKIDINEYINYWIVQLYMANTDWPGNNVKIWKEQLPDAKFRWLLFDADWTLGYTRNWTNPTTKADHTKNMLNFATNTANSGWPNDQGSTLIFRKLLQNTSFKNEFIQRFATKMKILFDANRCQTIADLRFNEVIDEKQAHFSRWMNEQKAGTTATMNRLNMADWENEFNYTKGWLNERQSFMEDHIKNHFNLGGTYSLNIPVNLNTNGSVLLNENEYKAPYNYSGKYFDNIPMRISAIPAPGYRFSHWLENNSTEAIQIFTTASEKTLTPVFEPAKELVINEIFYNPAGASESTEFIEVYNPDNKAKPLEGYHFNNGICFEFPVGATIAADEYIVLAKYASVYSGNGYQVFQWDDSSLNNDGELLVFMNPANEVLDSVRYNDNMDWPQEADGDGYSLALINEDLDNYLPKSWNRQLTSTQITPGTKNNFCTTLQTNATVANVSCNANADGFISLNATGGTTPYTYSWTSLQTTAAISNLSPGNYTVTLKDALQCEHIENFTITEPATLQAIINTSNESYFQANDGTASVTVNGGTVPYTYAWSNVSDSDSIGNLSPGVYKATVLDANGCQVEEQATIEVIDCSALAIEITKTDESYFQANDGTALVTVNGGASPYTYGWSNASEAISQTNLMPGTYSVEVQDAVGCSTSGSSSIVAFICDEINVEVIEQNISCANEEDGFLMITNMNGGTKPYSIMWSSGITGTVNNNLLPGNHSLTIKDLNGCSFNETYTITEPANIAINYEVINASGHFINDGAIDLTVSGGTAPYTFNWSNGSITEDINNIAVGDYWVQITDSESCTKILNNITVEKAACIDSLIQADYQGINSEVLQAADFIKTNGRLALGVTAVFKAANYIELLNGFEVNVGAALELKIENCE